jgi:hypothetical protein
MGRLYSKMVVVRIIEVVIRLITTGMMGVVRLGHINAIFLVLGVNWHKNVFCALHCIEQWGDSYPETTRLVNYLDLHVRFMGATDLTKASWAHATCVICVELLTTNQVCITIQCGHMFHC